jgi:phosphoglycolate phosphatase
MVSMKRLFENVDAVLFDLDGTLVETNIDFPLMRSEMLRIAAEVGVPERDIPNLDILGIVQHVEDVLGTGKGGEFRERAFQILQEIELRHSRDTKEIEHARELLDALKARGARVGIVTRNCRSASRMSVEMAGLSPDLLLSRDDVRRTKPHPEQLLAALVHLQSAPGRSVMVGDHLMDITAGKAAGMRTIGLLTPIREPYFFDSVEPDAVARNLKEILDAVIDSHS